MTPSPLGPLVDRLRGDLEHLGVDDPTLLGDFRGGRSELDVVTDAVMDLPAPERTAFLQAWEAPWAMLMVLRDDHPSLGKIVRWATDQPETVIVLATPSGPIPPAVQLLVAPVDPAVDGDGS